VKTADYIAFSRKLRNSQSRERKSLKTTLSNEVQGLSPMLMVLVNGPDMVSLTPDTINSHITFLHHESYSRSIYYIILLYLFCSLYILYCTWVSIHILNIPISISVFSSLLCGLPESLLTKHSVSSVCNNLLHRLSYECNAIDSRFTHSLVSDIPKDYSESHKKVLEDWLWLVEYLTKEMFNSRFTTEAKTKNFLLVLPLLFTMHVCLENLLRNSSKQ